MTVDEGIAILTKLSQDGKGTNELTVFRPFDDESTGGFESVMSIIQPDEAPLTVRVQCDDFERIPFDVDEDDPVFYE